MASSMKDLKATYRRHFKDSLTKIPAEEIEDQSISIIRKALTLEQYRKATSISIFLSMPGKEISTKELVLQALRDGKKVFVPYIYASQHSKLKLMDMLRIRDEDDLNSLQPDAWGIPSISAESVNGRENALGGRGCSEDTADPKFGCPQLDLIFMPAMAFDTSRHRLGHGKGFYDRYLTRYKELGSSSGQQTKAVPYLVGLALRQQILPHGENLPTTDLDWPVDDVITIDS